MKIICGKTRVIECHKSNCLSKVDPPQRIGAAVPARDGCFFFAHFVLIFAAGGLSGLLVPKEEQMLSVILTIISPGSLFSTFKRVNRIEKTFQLGMYLSSFFR